MARLTKEALLKANDLEEKDVHLPSIGGTVRIQSLSAWFSDEASSEAVELTEHRGKQKATVNTAKLGAIKVQHGLIDPKLDSIQEAEQFMRQCGPAAHTLVSAINEISGIDDDAVAASDARFQDGGGSEKGKGASGAGDGSD